MITLSIIIPVYNAADRIEKCIRSICTQTIQDIEIITVNDGSTDHSLEILEKLCEQDTRIKVLHYPNGGAAVARNRGLKVATGKYIGFVDADDWIEPRMFEKLIATLETDDTDIVVCNIQKEYDNKIETVLDCKNHEILSDNLLQKFILFEFDYAIYNKLYKRDFLVNHHISFDKDLRLSQDALFNLYAFTYINKLSIVPETFYHYVSKEGSLMSSPQDKRIASFNYIIRSFKKFCEEHKKDREWKIFEQYMGPGYQKYFFNLVLNSDHTERLHFSKYYKHVLRHLRLMDPLLLSSPLDHLSAYQRFRKGLLQQRRFQLFSLLAAVRHKII